MPYPADYGGVIDVFYRIKALCQSGVDIHLHCFTYGRKPASELLCYCSEVQYYQRDTSPLRLFGRRPYIVASRANDTLCRDLMRDDYPILLEGLHCCDILERKEFAGRMVMVRAHNVEADYYARLAQAERSLPRKLHFQTEARKLRRYEPILARAQAVLAVTDSDRQYFEALGCPHVLTISSSHPFDRVVSQTGRGGYVLFHGNLAVAENYRAAEYLLDNVFADGRYRFVVAGNTPPQRLRNKLAHSPNATLVDTPDDDTMQRLISEAHVVLLYTNQPTGLKLKLLNSLFAGRHILVNSHMVAGTDLGSLCTVADSPDAIRRELTRLMATDFGEPLLKARSEALSRLVPLNANAKIVELL